VLQSLPLSSILQQEKKKKKASEDTAKISTEFFVLPNGQEDARKQFPAIIITCLKEESFKRLWIKVNYYGNNIIAR
jgi:hypothetical protein